MDWCRHIVFEIISLIIEEKKWGDFTENRLERLFQGLKQKVEIISDKLISIEDKSITLLMELVETKSEKNQQQVELASEIKKRKLIENDYNEINAQFINMLSKYTDQAKLEE